MVQNTDIDIKLLKGCLEHIPQLAVLWYEEISKHWVSAEYQHSRYKREMK